MVVERIMEVFWLGNNEQIETPTPTEVGYNDGVNWHRGEERLPWSLQELQEIQDFILYTQE